MSIISRSVAVALVSAAALSAATQYYAHQFGYQPQLGPNWHRLYPPQRIVQWSEAWPQFGEVNNQALTVGIGAGIFGLLVAAAVTGSGRNKRRINTKLHGSARWATRADIKAAGLLGDAGVFVGRFGREYLRDSGPTHINVIAPTRSGKGVGLVVPTMLSWPASVVAIDPKGELYALTAGWRHEHAGQTALKFDPASLESAHWNPLDEIRINTEYEVGDIQNLAEMLAAPNGEDISSNHWKITGRSLLAGLIAFALREPNPSLPAVARLLADPARPFEDILYDMLESGIDLAARAARVQIGRPPNEAGSVKSTAESLLSLYADPVIARNVASSDFSVRDLMHADRPMSLYVAIRPDNAARLRPVVRLLLNTILRKLTAPLEFRDGQPVKSYKHPLLLMLDELPSLGRLGILEESIAYLAGFGIRCMLISQDLSQLRAVYGKDESLTANCGVTVAFQPNKLETAEYFSKLCGDSTIINENLSRNRKAFGLAIAGNVTTSASEVRRPLMTPDEVLRLPGPIKDGAGRITKPGEMLIFVNGRPAIRGTQPLYFQDPILAPRAAVPAP